MKNNTPHSLTQWFCKHTLLNNISTKKHVQTSTCFQLRRVRLTVHQRRWDLQSDAPKVNNPCKQTNDECDMPYLLYKHCPELLRQLWKILKVIRRRGRVADQWRWAECGSPKRRTWKTSTSFWPSHYTVLKGRCFSALCIHAHQCLLSQTWLYHLHCFPSLPFPSRSHLNAGWWHLAVPGVPVL